MSDNPTNHGATAAVSAAGWATEFERIYLMTATRIRGETVVARTRAGIARPGFVRGR